MYVPASGMLDGKPDYVRGAVVAVLTYGFSRALMSYGRKTAGAWATLAFVLELL